MREKFIPVGTRSITGDGQKNIVENQKPYSEEPPSTIVCKTKTDAG
jgi:hypothetical protein